MKTFNIKDAFIGIIAIFVYFFLNQFETIMFDIVNIDINEIDSWIKILYTIMFEILSMSIILLIFSKKIKKDFNDILKNHKKYYSENIKYWLIGLIVMIVSNFIIIYGFKSDLSTNEETIRALFKMSPIYIYFSAVIYAPVVEELIFRQGVRNIFGRNVIFIIISGLLFGALHVLGSFESTIDLLYIIPYSALGMAFAYMLYKTENIFVSMGFHFMHNGILLAIQFLVLLFS